MLRESGEGQRDFDTFWTISGQSNTTSTCFYVFLCRAVPSGIWLGGGGGGGELKNFGPIPGPPQIFPEIKNISIFHPPKAKRPKNFVKP